MPNDPREQTDAIVYTHPECGYCALLKEDLAAKGVPYVEVDVSREPSRWSEVEKATGGDRITPVTVHPDGTVDVGYNGIGCNFS